MEKFNEQITVIGNGKTKKDAILEGISKIRDVVVKKYPDLIIFHILPEDIKVLKSELTEKNFIKGESHQVDLLIDIEVKAMAIS